MVLHVTTLNKMDDTVRKLFRQSRSSTTGREDPQKDVNKITIREGETTEIKKEKSQKKKKISTRTRK